MDKYLYENMKKTLVIAVILSLILLFFDYRYSLSLLLGMIFSFFNLIIYNFSFKLLLQDTNFKVLKFIPIFLLSLLMISLPLLLGIFVDRMFNIWWIVIGLMLNKVILYFVDIFMVKRGDN